MASTVPSARLGRVGSLVLALLASLTSLSAIATGVEEEFEEYGRRVKVAQDIAPLGIDMFGDSVNYYNGSLSFSVSDLDIPGNDALPVRVGRTRSAADSDEKLPGTNGAFGDWELDVPYMKGLFTAANGWQVDGVASPTNRCSYGNLRPKGVTVSGFTWRSEMFWHGDTLYVPGAGGQAILQGNTLPQPADGLSKFATSRAWQVRCGVTVANPGSFSGEGFVVLSPDGTKYTFNQMTSREAKQVWIANGKVPYGSGLSYHALDRVEVRIYPTRVEDRFGNWVQYTWSGSQISQITSRDGRAVSFCYTSDSARIRAVAAGVVTFNSSCAPTSSGTTTDPLRVWTYDYSSGGYLSIVTLPDGTQWKYGTSAGATNGLPAFHILYDASAPNPAKGNCNRPGAWVANQGKTIAIEHPSGASALFQLAPVRQGRSHVVNDCEVLTEAAAADQGYQQWSNTGAPVQTDNFALSSKQISGLNMPTQTWSVAYAFSSGCQEYACSGVSDIETVTATNPDSSSVRYTFGVKHFVDEGKLKSTDIISGSNTLQTTGHVYATSPYPQNVGMATPGNSWPDDFAETYLLPVQTTTTTITQTGDAFSTVVNSFDAFARPVGVTRSNSFSTDRRTEVTTYRDFTGQTVSGTTEPTWVLGQVAETCVAPTVGIKWPADCHADGNRVIASATDFYIATAMPQNSYAFGLRKSTSEYNNTDGTLSRVLDGLNNPTRLENWKRGLPQTIVHADSASESAVINESGWITTITDAASNSISYLYDAAGRMEHTTFPAPFVSKDYSYVRLASPELNMPVNTWRARMTHGNLRRSIYFDARFNPVLQEEKDVVSNAARYLWRSFDYQGRVIYESYPSETLPSASAPGIQSTYDGLGRLIRRQTVATSPIVTPETIDYLSGNRRQVTDANGNATTTTYQAFDAPTFENATKIQAPEYQTTDITRDVFGNMTAATQSGLNGGSTVSVTHTYLYDAYMRLCMRTEPETGQSVVAYDAASNITWTAQGQSGLTSCSSYVPDAAKTFFTYDVRNRISFTNALGTDADVTTTYWPTGDVKTVANPASTWTYNYNAVRALKDETLNTDGLTFPIVYDYDNQQLLRQITYPSNRAVTLSPDAFGRSQAVGAYATGIGYHANNAVKAFAYGNGITYSLGLDSLQRPSVLQVMNGATYAINLTHNYDSAANLTSIVDASNSLTGGADSRTMAYDKLNRLTTASGVWGTYSYSYDPLNNLRARIGSSALAYNYNSANQLSSVSGATSRTYTYDAQGHVTGDGSKSFIWNGADRITSIPGVVNYGYDGLGKRIKTTKADGSVEYSIYSRAGVLVHTRRADGVGGMQSMATSPPDEPPICLGCPISTAGLLKPAAPTGLNPGDATAPGPVLQNVTLAWGASTLATSYRVWIYDQGGSFYSSFTTDKTSYPVPELEKGRSYRWVVDACNQLKCSVSSESRYFRIAAPPTGLNPGSTTAPGPTTSDKVVSLSWSASAGATSYYVNVYDLSTNVYVVSANTASTTYVASLEYDKPYMWYLAACGDFGCLGTDHFYFRTPTAPGGTAPSTPASPGPGSTSAPGPTTASNSVGLSWSASSGATSYAVNVVNTATSATVINVTTSSTTYTANLNYSTTYRWTVSACGTAGCSAATSVRYFQTPTSPVPATPASPQPGAGSAPGPTTTEKAVSLSWAASNGATSYSVTVVNVANGATVASASIGSTSYSVTLSYSTGYRWSVAACSSAGCSAGTANQFFQTPPPPVTRTDYISLNGMAIAEVRQVDAQAVTVTYLHTDLLGSPTQASGANGMLWTEQYDPYGMKVNGIPEKLGYTGHAFDDNTGLTYMQARFYDAQVGRFLSADPVEFNGANPFSFNRYAYANNNPYRYTDPTGMEGCGSHTEMDSASCSGETLGANAFALGEQTALASERASAETAAANTEAALGKQVSAAMSGMIGGGKTSGSATSTGADYELANQSNAALGVSATIAEGIARFSAVDARTASGLVSATGSLAKALGAFSAVLQAPITAYGWWTQNVGYAQGTVDLEMAIIGVSGLPGMAISLIYTLTTSAYPEETKAVFDKLSSRPDPSMCIPAGCYH